MPTKFCKDCCLKLGFFKKKVQCRLCMYHFCDQCFSKVKANEADLLYKLKNLSNPACLQCIVLGHDVIKREELFLLASKHLTEFLNMKNISVNNCTEKYHLVDLIMEFAETNGYKSGHDIENEIMRKQHIEELRQAEFARQLEDQQRQRESAQTLDNDLQLSDDTVDSPTANVSSVQEDNNLNLESRMNQNEQFFNSSFTSESQSNNVDAQGATSENVNTDRQENNDRPIDLNNSYEEPASSQQDLEFNNEPPLHQQSSHADSQPSQQSTSRNQIPSTSNQNNSSDSDQRLSQSNGLWKSIEDVTNEKEIKSLSILQLKQILTANFMNYRGCLEKEELVDKVKMLYASTKKVVLGENSTTSGQYEIDLCKICMDHVIDCVLLDCGHLVACTKCGKQLSQCPICKAFVVRVVHVFRV